MIRTLTHDDFESLFAAFRAAFSDYVVPLNPTREQFLEMITRRGWVPSLSVGAFEANHMVGFTINAVDGHLAYDTGTGVVPTHRRQGLARALMIESFKVLSGCDAYVLEVIDSNERAIALYRSLGFREERGLQCWGYAVESQSLKVSESQRNVEDPSLRLRDSETSRPFQDVQPSWQNSDASLARAKDPHETIIDEHGFAIVFPSTGDLPRLAVRPESRRKGHGTRLLNAAAALAGKPLRIQNVDDRDRGIAAFLEHVGARRTVRQLEMIRPLR